MKNLFRILGTQSLRFCAIALVAIIGLSMVTCGDSTDGTNGTSDPFVPGSDTKPNLNIPSNPSDIPEFDATEYAGYAYAATKEDLGGIADLLDGLFDDPINALPLGNLVPLKAIYNKSASAGRAAKSETINIKLSTGEGAPEDFEFEPIDGLTGFVNFTYSYNESDDDLPFPITANGSAQARLDLKESLSAGEDFDILGYVSGDVRVNTVKVELKDDAPSFSGSASVTIKIAINVADKTNKKFAKLIATLTVGTNLGKEEVTVSASYSAYGSGNSEIVGSSYSNTKTFDINDLIGELEEDEGGDWGDDW